MVSVKIVTANCINALNDVQAAVLWMELLFPGANLGCFIRKLIKNSMSVSSIDIGVACSWLESNGYLQCTHRVKSADHCEYRSVCRYAADGLVALRNRAVDGRWLPTSLQIREAVEDSRRYSGFLSYGRYSDWASFHRRSVVERALLGCYSTEPADNWSLSSDMVFDAASLLTGSLADGVQLLSGELDGSTDERFIAATMSSLFCAGRNVGSLLEKVRNAAVERHCTFPALAVVNYAALRCWRGESLEGEDLEHWIDSDERAMVPPISPIFALLSKGEWESAVVSLLNLVQSRIFSEGNVILLPLLALTFAVAVRVKAPDAKFNKLSQLFRKSLPMKLSSGWSSDPTRDKVCEWATKRVAPFLTAIKQGITQAAGAAAQMESLGSSFALIPLAFAMQSSSLTSFVDQGRLLEAGKHLSKQALKTLKNGYPLLSGILHAGASRFAADTDEYRQTEAALEKRPVPRLLERYESASEWKQMVLELAKIAGVGETAAEPTKGKTGTIFWGLTFKNRIYADEDQGGEENAPTVDKPKIEECYGVQPYFRGPRAPSDGSKDKPMTIKGVSNKLYRDLLTEQDHQIIEELLKSRYDIHSMRDVPWSVLEAMIDHPHLEENFKDDYYYYDDEDDRPPRAMMLTRLKWNLTSTPRPDGGIEFSLPDYLRPAVDFPQLVRFGLRDFRYLRLSERERKFVSGFFALAGTGKVVLPPAAMSSVSPVVAAMAKVVPMEGDFAALGTDSSLERIAGETIPTVRLQFKEDILTVALVLKPLAKNLALVVKPGVGSRERMVRDGKETKVLVRDLDAERAAAAKVTAAMADFESWADTETDWSIDDLGDALSALATLKELGEDAVKMEWRDGERLTVSTTVKSAGGLTSESGADRWFRVDGKFEVDEQVTMSLLELLRACRGRVGRFVQFGERAYARLSAELLRRLEALSTAGREREGKLAVASAALPMLDGVFSADDKEVSLPRTMRIEATQVREALAASHPIPGRLKAELRPYQEEGYVWLARLCACGYGACLADDMGLGKTVQIIALLLAKAADGPSLVVAPTSVGGNWRRELERFAPTLRCLCTWEIDDEEWLKAQSYEVVIASYGLLVSRDDKFRQVKWNGVILDEAQAIKNEGTERARTVKKLSAKFRVAATGTPIENRLTELWSIFDFINPGLLGTSTEFVSKLTAEGRATSALKNLVRPLILRRLKREVLQDLPEKTEITLSVPLEGAERAGYEACRKSALETLANGGKENRISILAELTRLRRYCCHPSLVLPDQSESAKMEALVELLRDLKGGNHRVLVFSQFTDYLALVEARLQAEGFTYKYLDGTTPPQERERLVADFQRGEGDVFLMSLKAGGTGLNLTAANYVVLLDPWWNPAVEDQAADRVHRIGQHSPVTVYRLVAADTVEERVLELHAEKKQLATDVLEGTASSSLTPETLMGLF